MIVETIKQEHPEYYATYICGILVPEFLLLDNGEIIKYFNEHFAVITASGFMTPSTVFSRPAVNIYVQQFLATLLKPSTFENPTAGGTSKKNINKIFL